MGLDHSGRGQAFLSIVPPGRWLVHLNASGWAGMSRMPGAEIAFTDHRGNHWVRRALGSLEELDSDSVSYFKIDRPVGWSTPGVYPTD